MHCAFVLQIAAHHARIAETRSKINALGMAFVAIEDDVESSWFSGSKPRMLAIVLVQDRVCLLPADRFCNGDEKKGVFDQQAAIDCARDPSAILMPADTFVLSRVETKRGDRSSVSLIDAAGATRRFRLRDTSDDVIVKLATLLQQCVTLRVELQDLETAEVREPHKFAVEDMAARVLQVRTVFEFCAPRVCVELKDLVFLLQFKEQGEVTSALLQTREAEVSRLQAAVAEHRVVSEALVHFLPAQAPVSSFFGMSMQSRVVTFRQNNVYFLPNDTPVESIHSVAASSKPDLRFARFEFKRVGGTKFALIGDDAKSTVYKFEAIDSIAAQATLEYAQTWKFEIFRVNVLMLLRVFFFFLLSGTWFNFTAPSKSGVLWTASFRQLSVRWRKKRNACRQWSHSARCVVPIRSSACRANRRACRLAI
jgi:hypothetical protein